MRNRKTQNGLKEWPWENRKKGLGLGLPGQNYYGNGAQFNSRKAVKHRRFGFRFFLTRFGRGRSGALKLNFPGIFKKLPKALILAGGGGDYWGLGALYPGGAPVTRCLSPKGGGGGIPPPGKNPSFFFEKEGLFFFW